MGSIGVDLVWQPGHVPPIFERRLHVWFHQLLPPSWLPPPQYFWQVYANVPSNFSKSVWA